MKGKKDKITYTYRKLVNCLLEDRQGAELIQQLYQEDVDDIWEEISTEMDIDQVWANISSDLDRLLPEDSDSGIILKIISAVLIFLTGMVPVRKAITDQDISETRLFSRNTQNEQPFKLFTGNQQGDSYILKQLKEDNLSKLRHSFDKGMDGNLPVVTKGDRKNISISTPEIVNCKIASRVLNVPREADLVIINSPHEEPIFETDISAALFPDDPLKIKLEFKPAISRLIKTYNPISAGFPLALTGRGRFSGGYITLLKNTWLLNNETIDGLKSESLNTTEIVFLPDMGLSLNYSINKRWSLQTDGFFFSNSSQKYFEYIHGYYSRKLITLKYSTIDLYLKYKLTGHGDKMNRCSINLLTGCYLSVLRTADQKINADLESIGKQYRKYDLGLRLGGETEMLLFNNLSLAPGIFISLGIPNIYKGDGYIPGYLRRTHNGSAEFHIAFYYHFN